MKAKKFLKKFDKAANEATSASDNLFLSAVDQAQIVVHLCDEANDKGKVLPDEILDLESAANEVICAAEELNRFENDFLDKLGAIGEAVYEAESF